MKTTRYFKEQVFRKRPYLRKDWIQSALKQPIRIEIQPDGRVRYWIRVPEVDRYLRVVTLEDGTTVHNAFFDRNFDEAEP